MAQRDRNPLVGRCPSIPSSLHCSARIILIPFSLLGSREREMWKKKLGSANQKMNTRRLITALKAKKPGNRPKLLSASLF